MEAIRSVNKIMETLNASASALMEKSPSPSSSSAYRSRSLTRRPRDEGQENAPPLHPNIPPPSPPLLLNKAKARADDFKLNCAVAPAEDASPQDSLSSDASVKVVVRIRPVNRREREGVRIVRKLSSDSLSADDRKYTFDSCPRSRLVSAAAQDDVFKLVGVRLVRDSLAGFNTSILCYGQTGSGKTYTMWGPPSAMLDYHAINGYQGIVPRIFHLLFSEIQNKQVNSEEKQISYQVRCSFLEIYNEGINDLLDPTQRKLQIRNDVRNGFHVENLTEEYVTTVENVIQILVKGLSNRKVGATSVNSKSSRSHIIFTCTIESWCKGSSSKCFSSSKISRINLVDLAGWDTEKTEGVSRHIINEGKHVKQSLSKLGNVVNILAEIASSGKDQKIPYMGSCLTNLLQDTLGGNSKTTFVCAISPNDRQKPGTLSTLRFGERAKLMQNTAVINEITEDHVNGLSDQIRQLKEELIRAKSYNSSEVGGTYFRGKNARDSLNLLRVSLSRSLILPHVDNDSEDELDVDEDDVLELCSQLSDLTSSFEEKSKDIKESKNSMTTFPSNAKTENVIVSHLEGSEEESIPDEVHSVTSDTEFLNTGIAELPLLETCLDGHAGLNSAMNGVLQDSPRKSCRSTFPCLQLPLLQDPTVCLSPKIDNSLKKSTIVSSNLSAVAIAPESPVSNSEKQHAKKCDSVRSSLQSSKIFTTESLAASLHRGLQIIDYHQQNSPAKRSPLALSFQHLASVSCLSADKAEAVAQASADRSKAAPSLCSACKKELDVNHSLDMQILATDDTVTPELLKKYPLKDDDKASANATKSTIELEALCTEQAAMIKQLNCLVDQCKHEHQQTSPGSQEPKATSLLLKNSTDDVMPIKETESEHVVETEELREKDLQEEIQNKTHQTTTFELREKETLLKEIRDLKNQLRSFTDVSTNGSLLDRIRNGSSSTDYEEERQKWTESESRWISLTEELRIDLESNRRLAEEKDAELNLEKKCTAELDDALQRSILGHGRIIEHYVELQEQHNELLGRHRKVMGRIVEVKKAASKAGSKGAGKAFAAALAAEVSTLQIERERERAFLKEQNKGLRIQLRDTAEAVHAAGELLVRLREAEEAVSVTEKKYAQAQQENEKLRKQVEKMKKKHAMEMETMKHYLGESRLPESALEPLFNQDSETLDETRAAFRDDDQSWRAAFTPSYQ